MKEPAVPNGQQVSGRSRNNSDSSLSSNPDFDLNSHRDSVSSRTSDSSMDAHMAHKEKFDPERSNINLEKTDAARAAKKNATVALERLSPNSTSPPSPNDEYVPDVSKSTSDPLLSNSTSAKTSAPEPPKRKSRILSRKTDHSVIERRRREKINERLIRLQETVPACREEATEMLSSKMIKKRKRTQEEIKAEIGEKMVLEKLCIISHTVDYVEELRTQIEAYKKLCACDPPLPAAEPIGDKHHHQRFAHEHDDSQQKEPSLELNESKISSRSSASVAATLAVATDGTNKAAPKRKRHWGSNRPPRVENPKNETKASVVDDVGRKRARRKSASKRKNYYEEDDEEEDELDMDLELESEDEDGRLGQDGDGYQPNKDQKQRLSSRKNRDSNVESEEDDDEDYMDGLEDSRNIVVNSNPNFSLSRLNERRASGTDSIGNSGARSTTGWSAVSTSSSCNRGKVRAGWPASADSNERGTLDPAQNQSFSPTSNGHIHDTSCLSDGRKGFDGTKAKVHPSISLSHLYSSRPVDPNNALSLPNLSPIRENRVENALDSLTGPRPSTRSERNRTQSLSSRPSNTFPTLSQPNSTSESSFCPQHPSKRSSRGNDPQLNPTDSLSLLATVCRCSVEKEV